MKSSFLASLLLVSFYLESSPDKQKKDVPKKQKNVTACTPIPLTKETFNEAITSDLAFVLITATWCGACKKMCPVFEETAKQMKEKAQFMSLDFGNDFYTINPLVKKLEERYKLQVRSIPTLLIIKNDLLVEQVIGSQTKEQLTVLVKKHTALPKKYELTTPAVNKAQKK